jgi:hypothetical protein
VLDALGPLEAARSAGRVAGDPVTRTALGPILDALGSVARSTETSFLEIGARLEIAIDVVGRLAGTFETVRAELESEALQSATRDLMHAADRVFAIASAQHGEQATMAQLGELTVAINRRVPAMGKAIGAVEVLAINAKIAAAGIGASGADFQGFLSGLTRPLGMARTSLARFSDELGEVAERVRAACRDQEVFARRQAEVASSIPRRLAAGVDAMATHSARAATAAGAIGRRSQQVRDRIAAAIAALQIGDATRQRVEHVVKALAMLIDAPPASVGWDDLTDAERAGAAAALQRLQAAQLADAGEELERELQRISGAFSELATDAREIVRLGQAAYAASDRQHGSFLLELQEQVDAAHALLLAFADARRDAAQVVAAVSDAAGRLVGHISFIGSLEADLRIMGLNTTFKCARLGASGRPLSVIAQELRVYASDTATEAAVIVADLERARTAAASLAHQGQGSGTADIAALAAMMTDSMARFAAAGRSLESALGALDRDSDAVARLLADTASHIADRQASSRALHQASRDLVALAERYESGGADAGAALDALLGVVEHRYTMGRERAIHASVVHGRTLPATACDVAAIDDMLF